MKVRAQLGTVEYYSIVAVLGLILIAMAGIAVRQRSTERRVSALESKPCLLTGAHVGCERGSAR